MSKGHTWFAETLAEQMRKSMAAKELRQIDVAELTGLSISTINRMYNARPDGRGFGSLYAWAQVLDVLNLEVGFRYKPLDK